MKEARSSSAEETDWMDETCNGISDDKIMLEHDFTSSSEDEDCARGLTNISFESEVNSHAVLYKTFGSNGTRGGNLKDGPDIQVMEKGKCVVSDLLNGRLIMFSKSGKNTLSLHNEETIEPWGVAVHQDIILVTSRRKKLVVKLSQTGDCDESSFGESFFQDPCGLAVSKDHRIIVSDTISRRVSVHEWNGKWSKDLSLPDNRSRSFKTPRYVTVSPLGDTIVSDSGNHCIYLFSENGQFKKTFGSYGSNDGQLKSPYGVSCDQFGNIFVADHYNDRVSFFTKDGEFIRQMITKSDGIYHPQGISISSEMKLYVTHGSLKACEIKVYSLISNSSRTDGSPVFRV